MIKIGIDTRLTYYRDGGISTYIRRLIDALSEMQSQSHQITIFQSRKDPRRISDTFEHSQLWTPAHHTIERIALSIELAWRNLDVFHSPDFIPPYRAAKRHVITVHDLTFLHYPQYLTAESRKYYNQQIAGACRHANAILAVSQATKQDLITMLNVPESKIYVQPHGVDSHYQRLPDDEIGKVLAHLQLPRPYFLHVGTWEPRKNILGLIQGYKLLLQDHPDAPPVLLVGRPGWLFEETRTEIQRLGISDRILWRDNVSDAQLPAIYNAAAALISASFYEGFGMPALEAMACGTIPIVSNRSSFPEVVGNIGLLIDPDDPQTIAQALHQILSDTSWVQSQSEAAAKRAKQFTWKQSAEIALQAYTSVL